LAWAQDYPARPVRIIVGFFAGSAADITARLIGQWLSERLGQPFIIENRPGASGNLATQSVAKASPDDGYTLLLVTSINAWNTTIYDNLSLNFIRDIAPVASISRSSGVLVVNPSFPARTVPELIAYGKANPGKINMASVGPGSTPHVYGELFKKMTGIDMLHVPYPRVSPMPDLLGGQVQVMFSPIAPSIDLIRAGKLRALAVTAATRQEALPDIPAVAEFVPGYEASGWIGIGAPKNTPVEIIDKLNKEINAGLADPTVAARLADLGAEAFASSPASFGEFIVEFTKRWGKVIRAANIKAE
jgi:tripartite-type tricarboxylate transporter receptor subunit TctC